MGRKKWQLGSRRKALMFGFIKLHAFFIFYINGIVFSSFAYLIYFPRLHTILLVLNQLPKAQGKTLHLGFILKCVWRGWGVWCERLESLPILLCIPWLSLSVSMWTLPVTLATQVTPRGFVHVEWMVQITVAAASLTQDPSFEQSCNKIYMPCPWEYLHAASTHVDTEMRVNY